MTSAMTRTVGQRITRNEDRRHLRGQGSFVGDIRLAGQREVAFVRSPVAHGVLRAVTYEPAASKVVLTLAMWIGRLEVITVLVLLRFEAWRSARWAAAV